MLAYSDEGDGPAIVFAHGIGSTRTRWRPIIERLRGDHRCVAVDLPGFGDSPAKACNAIGATSAVNALVVHLELDAPTIVGHSLGSTLALIYGARFEARSVVAIDPAPLYTPHLTDRVAPFIDRLVGDDFDTALVEFEVTTFDPGPLTRDELIASMVHPRQEVLLAYWEVLFDRDRVEAGARSMSDALARMATPAWILLAAAASPEDQAILDRMNSATVEVWDGEGHWLHLADPDRFTDRLRSWIAGQTG